ncbi:N-6 DNA methylase [Vibrio penaeicida]|uniref:N-6 DNA methylase n=1 Tax=Vibrio penaeicida TaxID=104609 RepID=UPI001CC3B0E8|nr:N-6 DNA methylase [Vibrio penaeicida]
MNTISKLIIEIANKHNKRPTYIYESLIDMTYQMRVVKDFSKRYDWLKEDFLDFLVLYISEVDQNPFEDLLGFVLFEINALDKKGLGQCFTPPDIARLLSKLTNSYVEGESCSYGSFSDICCGSGSLVLAQMETIHETKQHNIKVIINDIDELMVKTAVVQVLMNEMHLDSFDTIHLKAYRSNALTEYMTGKDVIFAPDLNHINDKDVVEILERRPKPNFDLHRRVLDMLEDQPKPQLKEAA